MAGDRTLEVFRSDVLFALLGQSLASIGQGSVADGQDRLDRWINWAYRYICMPRVFRHTELQTTDVVTLVAGDNDYALDSAVAAVYSCFWQNSLATTKRKLTPNSQRRFDDRQDTNTGQPTEYAIWSAELVLYPRPGPTQAGDTVTVRGWQRPILLVAGAKTVIAPEWDEVIKVGAIAKGWDDLDEYNRAAVAYDRFGTLVNDITDRMKVEGEDTGSYVEFDSDPYMGEMQ